MGLRFKTVVNITLVASMAYAAFGAAVAYLAGAPAALASAFVLGYGALLFLLPFSVNELEFLWLELSIVRTPPSVQACAAVTPVAVLTVLNQARAGNDIAFATGTVWVADVAAVLSLAWCLTHGGVIGMAFTRRGQYEESWKARERMMNNSDPNDPAAVLFALDLGISYAAAFFSLPMLCLLYFQNTYAYPVYDMPKHLAVFDLDHLDVIRCACVRFVAAVSSTCAVAGGLMVGGMSWISLFYAVVFFSLPMCVLYFRENYSYSVSDMPKQLEWCYVSDCRCLWPRCCCPAS